MSNQYPGGLITKNPVTPSGPYETSTASGIWTLDEQAYWNKLGQWPTAGNKLDAQFNYVTMLLHGDGTNGAQNNTFLDSSTNNYSITRNGNTTQGSFSPYGSNWSNYFAGSANYLSTPSNAVFGFGTGDFTMEAWIYCTTSGSVDVISISGSSVFYVDTGQLAFYGGGGYGSGTNITYNAWTHVAVVRSSSTLKFYINGVQTANSFTVATNLGGGVCNVGFDGSSSYFNGYISNFRIVKGTAVYTSNFTPSTTPLTAISGTSLLTCQSNRFIDNSTNAFAITVNGTPSVQRFNPFGTSTAYSTSVIGGSGYFDGSGDYLTFSPSTSFAFGTGDFTIEFWINTGGVSANGAVLDSTTNGSYWAIRFSGTTLYYQSASGITNLATPTISTLSQSAWTHVAIVRASGTTKIYANGVQVSSTADSTNYTATTTYQIAKSSDSSQYTGYFSDIRVVKGTAVYIAAFTPPSAPLSAITNTSFLASVINGAIFDNAMMNDLETAGNAQISTSVKKYGTGSMYFDGTGDYLQVPSSPNYIFTGDFTVEMWLYVPTGYYQTIQRLVSSATASPAGSCYFSLGNDQGIGAGYLCAAVNLTSPYNLASGNPLLYSSTLFPVATWTHVALVRSGSTVKIYQAGVSVASVTNTATWNFNNSAGLRISGSTWSGDSSENLQGYIDDLRITAGYARYTSTFTPPTAAFPNVGPT